MVASSVILSMSGIACGSLRRIDAAILLMDFCGYAALTERTDGAHMGNPGERVFRTHRAAGARPCGELLKFMGDGVLATFSLKDLQDDMVCLTALNAAIGALNNVQEWNAEREASGTPLMERDVAA
jgi:adenylate cyclase